MFRDRIISAGEMEGLDTMMAETAKKYLSEFQVKVAKVAWLLLNIIIVTGSMTSI